MNLVHSRPVNLHPLFLKIGHPAFWKLGTLLFEKNRVQKTKVIVIQKEKRQPGLFSFWIKNDPVFFSLLFEKSRVPHFQKAGCPIFKNSGCRLAGRMYPRPKNPNFSPTQHMYVLRPVYLETTSTKWHWQHPRHFYPRPYICMEQKENSNNCRSPNTKDILYACTYLNKWETPMNKLTSSICKPRSQKEFNKIACKYAPAVLYSNLGTILYAEFPKIGCKQEGSQIGNNKQNCHMRPKVE